MTQPDPSIPPGTSGATWTFGHSSEGGPTDNFPVIEGYDVIDLLGRGGMGAVYEAFQQSTGRRVAVKLMLERAAGTEGARRRFEREVELIARLQHPGIVGILDSGVHRGRYFFVMEHVAGKPLDETFAPGKGEVSDILRTIAKVARAVDYAHQRGVMHRDLKPSNIIVDERAEPRLLDFGLAKAFDPNSMVNIRDSLSEPGQIIGTLGYMSPEQARGDMQRISVRSDVYSLGAIAYELITGVLPCAIDGPMSIVFQRIESRDPTRPSQIRRAVSADVDAVLLKALEKDPAKRYTTAADLAEDIERWLADRPVSARRSGPILRTARWCRRNPAAAGVVASLLVLVVVVVGSLLITSWAETRRFRAETARALRQKAFVQSLTLLSPDLSSADRLKAENLMLHDLETGVENEKYLPEEEAPLRILLGDKYRQQKDTARAEEQYTKAQALYRKVRKDPDPEVARCIRNIAATYFDRGMWSEAETLYRESLAMRMNCYQSDHLDVADSMNHLAATLMRERKMAEAEDLQIKTLEMRRRIAETSKDPKVAEEADAEVVKAGNNLGSFYLEDGQYEKAERLYQDALDRMTAKQGTENRNVARGMKSIARCRMAQLKSEGVADLLNRAQGILERTLSSDDPEVAQTIIDRAWLFRLEKRYTDAESEGRRGLELLLRRVALSHQDVASARVKLARILAEADKGAEALAEADQARRIYAEETSPIEVRIANADAVRGCALRSIGKLDEAEPVLRSALEILERSCGIRTRATQDCAADLAAVLEARGDKSGAAEVLARISPR